MSRFGGAVPSGTRVRRLPPPDAAAPARTVPGCGSTALRLEANPRRLGWLAVFVAVLWTAGCGYRLIGTQIRYPEGIRSVEVGPFENRSREFGLDRILAFAFEREFHRRGVLRLVEQPGSSDAVLSGTIRQFVADPVAFDARDEALQYEAELVIDLLLRRQSDGKILWQASNLRHVEDYTVAARIVVPSTSEFQQSTLAVADLRRLTDIQLAQTERRLAIERLIDLIVRDVHDRIFDDF